MTNFNLDDIKAKFDKVITWSQNIPEPQTKTLFENWYAAKEKYIKAFGGLIYECPEKVSFHLDSIEKERKVNKFVNDIDIIYNNKQLSQFVKDNFDTFFENRVSHAFISETVKIFPNSKLTKTFKYFEKDKKVLEALQIQASQIIQEDRIEGTLCFSVHPLDFLSSSENTYNWRTCHSLTGEYRVGNLSYMQDTVTCIVYLKGEDGVKLPMFPEDVPWNSKKWRTLLYTGWNGDWPQTLFAGRQYPFFSKDGLNIILQKFHSLIHKCDFCTYSWQNDYVESIITTNNETRSTSSLYIAMEDLYKLSNLVVDAPGSLHFNDILESSIYTRPYYVNFYYNYPKPMVIGSPVICLHCGKELISDSETMRCEQCELDYGDGLNDKYTYCDCCGVRMIANDGIIVGGNELICQDCYEKECFICDECDEVFYKDELHVHEGKNYCEECFKENI